MFKHILVPIDGGALSLTAVRAACSLAGECDTPHVGIIATAEERGCDLIFMASHGRRGAIAVLLGSETLNVVTHCRIPVLVHR